MSTSTTTKSKTSRVIARRNQVAMALFGTVKAIARRHFHEDLLSFEDLVQTGVAEVLIAVGDHDPRKHRTTLIQYVRSRAWSAMRKACRDARRGLPALREADLASGDDDHTPFDRAGRDQSPQSRIDDRDELASLIGAHCSPRESLVLSALYGITGRDPETMTGVGRSIGIGRDRVRQVRDRAIESLRSAVNGEWPSVYERAHQRL